MTCALAMGLARPAACATPPPPEEVLSAAVAEETADKDGGSGLNMFPVAYWGNLAYELRGQDVAATGEAAAQRSLQQYLTARLDAATYVWQPWFGVVKAGVGATMGWSDAGGGAPAARDAFLTGSASLNLFPRSAFPFDAFYEATDTRVEGGLVALPPARWTRFGVRQAYYPAGLPFSVSGRFEQSEQQGQTSGRDVQQTFDLSGEGRWHQHSLSVTANANRNRRGLSSEEADFGTIYARHSYMPSADFSFESNANVTRNWYSGSAVDADTRVIQYTGLGFWRPAERPYTVTGTARLLAFDAGAAGSTRSGNATLGATYDASRSLRYSANAGVGYATSRESDQLLYAASAGASYTADAIVLADYEYSWNASANLNAAGRSGGADDSRIEGPSSERNTLVATGSFTHSLGRLFALPRQHTLGALVSQTVSAAKSSEEIRERDDALRLATELALTYTAGGAPVNGYARLTLTDSRSLTRSDSVFQMANLQVSGTWEFSRFAQLTGELTAQWVRSQVPPRALVTAEEIAEGGTRAAASGISANIAYRNQRVLGVPRLRFLSELRIASDAVLEQEQRQLLPDRESMSWENRLDYLIGRLNFSLSLRLAQINDSRTTLAMLRVQRDFDGVAFR